MDIKEEITKIEAEMKALQERFLILTGAKQAFEAALKALQGGDPELAEKNLDEEPQTQ